LGIKSAVDRPEGMVYMAVPDISDYAFDADDL